MPTYVVWPVAPLETPDPAYRLPAGLETAAKQYTGFYRQSWPNRQLQWLHHLSRVVLCHAGADGRVYELVVTIPQANVLIQFQDQCWAKAASLMELCGSSWRDFLLVVNVSTRSRACPPLTPQPIIAVGLLRWRDEGCMLPDGELGYDAHWSHGRSRVRLCHFTLGSSVDSGRADGYDSDSDGDGNEDGEGEDEQRGQEDIIRAIARADLESGSEKDLPESKRYFLQAIVVRLLKAHRELSFARLLLLVSEQASQPGPQSFHFVPSHIKALLDQLAEKQYVECDPKRDVYLYLP